MVTGADVHASRDGASGKMGTCRKAQTISFDLSELVLCELQKIGYLPVRRGNRGDQVPIVRLDSLDGCSASEVRGVVLCVENHSSLTRPGDGVADEEPLLFRGVVVICRTMLVQQIFSDQLTFRTRLPLLAHLMGLLAHSHRRAPKITLSRNDQEDEEDRVDVCLCFEMFPNPWLRWSISRSVDLPMVWFGRCGSRFESTTLWPRRSRLDCELDTARTNDGEDMSFETWTGGR